MRYSFSRILQGLVDGSGPLPLPHPQRLSFPKDAVLIDSLAGDTLILTEQSGIELEELEVRHLLFKLASWCRRRGRVDEESLNEELRAIWPAVEMALVVSPLWVTSRAGVSVAIRRFYHWQGEALRKAYAELEEPLWVADVPGPLRGCYVVELMNSAHVFHEGMALGHCLSWSVNVAAQKKRGYPSGGPEVLDCLTYAVKLRSRELRLFSVRGLKDQPVMTIAYQPKQCRVVAMEQAASAFTKPWEWSRFRCDVVRALSSVVTIKSVFPLAKCGRTNCRNPGWCETAFKSGDR